jgi:hypothetical protein
MHSAITLVAGVMQDSVRTIYREIMLSVVQALVISRSASGFISVVKITG